MTTDATFVDRLAWLSGQALWPYAAPIVIGLGAWAIWVARRDQLNLILLVFPLLWCTPIIVAAITPSGEETGPVPTMDWVGMVAGIAMLIQLILSFCSIWYLDRARGAAILTVIAYLPMTAPSCAVAAMAATDSWI